MKILSVYIGIGLLLFANIGLGQTVPTIREVFDFEVGDGMHYRYQTHDYTVPPIIYRYEITGKYYSQDSSTLYYTRHYNNVLIIIIYNPSPHAIYTFPIGNDTLEITNLDSSITSLFPLDTGLNDLLTVTSNPSDPWHFNFPTIGYTYSVGTFEPVTYSKLFGTGAGLMAHSYYNPTTLKDQGSSLKMIYLYKDGICYGNPDWTKVDDDIEQAELIHLYPNPSNTILTIAIDNAQISTDVLISNVTGQIIKQASFQNQSHIEFDVSDLDAGVYFLRLSTDQGAVTKKVVVQH